MAQVMAAKIFADAGLKAEVASAGVNAWDNQPASRHAISAMKEAGLCLRAHRAAIVSEAMMEEATLVLAMTGSHRAVLLSDYPGATEKIFTLGGYVGDDVDVCDPFGGSLEEYRACAAQIKEMLLQVTERLS